MHRGRVARRGGDDGGGPLGGRLWVGRRRSEDGRNRCADEGSVVGGASGKGGSHGRRNSGNRGHGRRKGGPFFGNPIEGKAHFCRRNKPMFRLRCHRPMDQSGELGRSVRRRFSERADLATLHLPHHGKCIASNRPCTGEHFVEDHADRVQIGPRVDLRRLVNLLGGHVLGGPHQHASDGEEDVVRFEIPMDDAKAVGRFKAGQDLTRVFDRNLRRQPWLPLHLLPERLPFEEFHHQVGDRRAAVGRLFDVHHTDDVRTLDLRGNARLLEEALDDSCMLHQFAVEHFYRDAGAEADVLRFVDGPHPAVSEEPKDASGGDGDHGSATLADPFTKRCDGARSRGSGAEERADRFGVGNAGKDRHQCVFIATAKGARRGNRPRTWPIKHQEKIGRAVRRRRREGGSPLLKEAPCRPATEDLRHATAKRRKERPVLGRNDVGDVSAVEGELLGAPRDQHPPVGDEVAGAGTEKPAPEKRAPSQQAGGAKKHRETDEHRAGKCRGLNRRKRMKSDDFCNGAREANRRGEGEGEKERGAEARELLLGAPPGLRRGRRPENLLAGVDARARLRGGGGHAADGREDGVGGGDVGEHQGQCAPERPCRNGAHQHEVPHARRRPDDARIGDAGPLDRAPQNSALPADVGVGHRELELLTKVDRQAPRRDRDRRREEGKPKHRADVRIEYDAGNPGKKHGNQRRRAERRRCKLVGERATQLRRTPLPKTAPGEARTGTRRRAFA
ncbi:hypothetical protein OUZ56_032598 [Daphnia magna]|uniref:Uncharacterized protein n=1 Tax=Daphnia magna TaxID=35525 RepID=A0ABR0B9D4_9CRUS|nr:hypothetical protein OUZ56_032598 [Daphnia magna]